MWSPPIRKGRRSLIRSSRAPGQLRYEAAGGTTTIFGDVNGDGLADLAITLSGQISLGAADFLL